MDADGLGTTSAPCTAGPDAGDALSRRGFLRNAAMLAAGAWAGGCRDTPPGPAGGSVDVVVAGAGLAGLAAAGALARAGREVMVLEARDRPGGRVHTLREPFDDGLYAEAGAVLVPGHHDHTLRFAREHGVALAPAWDRRRATPDRVFVAGRMVATGADGRMRWPAALGLHPAEQGLGADALRDRYLGPLVEALGDPTHPSWPGEAALAHDAVSLAALLRARGASEGAVRLIRLGYLDEWGDGVDAVSALFLLRDLAMNARGGEAFVIPGGSDRLPRAMAARLAGRIRYGTAVAAIRTRRRGVEVSYREGGAARTVRAGRVVCALPFPVLRTLDVAPALDGAQGEAVRSLPATSVTRIYLQLSRRAWNGDPPASVATDLPVMLVGDATRGQPGDRGVLEAFITGANARRAAVLSPDDRIAFAVAHMERMHPGLEKHVERGASYAWDADPWARGDYAWFRPGQMRRWLPHLAVPAGRLHFAGDHTSASPGWMQGALASGLGAADEVLADGA